MATAKSAVRVAVAAASVLAWHGALANPTGPTVAHGNATFQQNGSRLTITNTPSTIINWQEFSIGIGETTDFVQQSAASAVLNRVAGAPVYLVGPPRRPQSGFLSMNGAAVPGKTLLVTDTLLDR